MKNKLLELFNYRELLFTLTVKELKVQYKNSILGFFWSLLNPLLMMLIFTFVFAYIFKFGIKHFPIFLLCGLLPWNFFNIALTMSTGSVVSNSNLIKKVYFPREILPLSVVLANLVNFLLSLVVLFVFLIIYGYNFYVFVPFLAVAIAIQLVMIVGLSLLLAGLNVYFRDIQYIVGVGLLALFYATPVIYPLSLLEKSYWMQRFPWMLTVYKLNPMVPVVSMYRSLLYENQLPSVNMVLYGMASAAVLLVLGYYVFHRLEPAFAEEV